MLTAGISVLPLVLAFAQQYTVRTLQPLALTPAAARFEPGTRAAALAADGRAGGASVTDTETRDVHACRWNAAGQPVDLGVLGTDVHSMVLAGNEAGDLVGASFVLGQREVHGVMWTAEGATVSLGNFEPADVNGSRVIAGSANAAGNVPACTRAVRWAAGVAVVLPPLAGGPSARASSINDQGWIVGSSILADRMTTHACLWTASGAPIDLGTLGGATSYARSIVGATVVGVADRADGVPHACRWTLGASGAVLAIDDLGTLAGTAGAVGSSAEALSTDGRIGGNSGDAAVLFENGGAVDLNTRIAAKSGWQLTHVTSLGAGGRVVGRGRLNGIPRGFVLEPAATVGDLNGDGTVDGADLGQLLAAWGACNCAQDLNGDGQVNGADLGLLLANWSAQ